MKAWLRARVHGRATQSAFHCVSAPDPLSSVPYAPVLTSEAIRTIETRAHAADPSLRLMERAGLAASKLARQIADDRGKPILVVAGPGNNGGDAFELAVHLKRSFHAAQVVFLGEATRLPADAARAFDKWRQAGGMILDAMPSRRSWSLVVDGLFGIGLARAPSGPHAAAIAAINAASAPILALDIPSGLDGDTGVIHGTAVHATHTITFIALKPGLLTLDGPDHTGLLACDALGLDDISVAGTTGHALDQRALDPVRVTRPHNFHKGRAGALAIIGGTSGMVGAAVLAGRAAIKCGVGKVFLGLVGDSGFSLDVQQPELMIRSATSLLPDPAVDALAIGPGMGTSTNARELVAAALRSRVPLVLDADALNLLGSEAGLARSLAKRAASCVLTPHPAEAARLLGQSVQSIQADRLKAARAIASRFNAYVVLKGNGSVLAAPDGRWWINRSGHSGMAVAGMGDVLTGLIGALLAQGIDAERALTAGVYLHGAAGDACVARGIGPVGLTASELSDAARVLINAPRQGSAAA